MIKRVLAVLAMLISFALVGCDDRGAGPNEPIYEEESVDDLDLEEDENGLDVPEEDEDLD